MAIKYSVMSGKKFLGELRNFEPNLQRIHLPYGTDLAVLPEFEETIGTLRKNESYTPNLEGLQALGLIAPRLYLPPESILKGADLRLAVLRGADLERTDLRWADLRRTDLSGAF